MVARKRSKKTARFDAQAFLDSAGMARRIAEFRLRDVIFSQGDPSDTVLCLQKGGVQISVLSAAGRQAIVATLGPGDFFGEGALAGERLRMGTATSTTASTVLIIEKRERARLRRVRMGSRVAPQAPPAPRRGWQGGGEKVFTAAGVSVARDEGFMPYRHLAIRVLARALLDVSNPSETGNDREGARLFFAGSPMLLHWCRVAAVDPRMVMECASDLAVRHRVTTGLSERDAGSAPPARTA